MQSDASQKPVFSVRVESLTKLSLALAGLAYILGLIVTALYLAQYGITALNLIRIQYILAGAWLLVPLLIVALFWIGIFSVVSSIIEPTRFVLNQSKWSADFNRRSFLVKETGKAVVISVILAYMLYASLRLMVREFMPNSPLLTLFAALYKSFSGITVLMLLSLMCLPFLRAPMATLRPSYSIYSAMNISFACIGVISSFAYISYFTNNLYPSIPAVLGGGLPTPIQFILKQDVADSLTGARAAWFSQEHYLLLATDRAYIVLNPDNPTQAVEIPRDIFNGVVFRSQLQDATR